MTGPPAGPGGRRRVERVYPQPPALVWRALTDAALLGRRLMPNDFRPEPGHRFRFTLEPVAAGTRLVVTHTGFRGARGRVVQWILGIGNRTLDGKRLPQLLASPQRAERTPAPAPLAPAACMSPWRRVLIPVTGWLPGRRRRGDPPPSV